MYVEGLRLVTVHRSLTRPNLMAGAEREPFLVLGIVNALLIFVGMNLVTLLFAIALQMIGTRVLQSMGKADPQLIQVYIRHSRVQSERRALGTIFAITKAPEKWG